MWFVVRLFVVLCVFFLVLRFWFGLNRALFCFFFFFSSRRRHTRWPRDWSSDVCSSDLSRRGQRGGGRDAVTDTDRSLDADGNGHRHGRVHGARASAAARWRNPQRRSWGRKRPEAPRRDRKSVV